MNSIQLLAPNHSMEQRVNDYMRPFHTASCQEHLIGALQQLPRSASFAQEESSIREQVALRLLQEVIVMGAQEQEALDACLVVCGPLEALSACASTLQEIATKNGKSKKKYKRKNSNNSVDSPSILETALRTIRRWLVKGVSFPSHDDHNHHDSSYYEERCWVERVTTSMSRQSASAYYNHNQQQSPKSSSSSSKNMQSPLVQACLESVTKLVLLFPVQISNACHALGVQLPSWAIASRYNPRLIEGALSMAIYQQEREEASYSASYFRLLVQHMVRSRNPDDVALGLYKYHERHFRKDSSGTGTNSNTQQQQPKVLCQLLLQLHRQTLSPRESAYLLRSIMISSIPRQSHATKIAAVQLAELWQRHLYPYMELSCRPILVASRRVREAFVRLLVLSPSSVLTEEWPDRLLCHCAASLLANPKPPPSQQATPGVKKAASSNSSSTSSSSSSSSTDDDVNDDSDSDSGDESVNNPQDEVVQHHAWLARHAQEVIATWSLAVFVRQTDCRLQRHVTNFLLSSMCFLQLQNVPSSVVGGMGTADNKDGAGGGLPTSDLVAGLLEGVTVRLESSTPEIRKDGMVIAEKLAQKMGQELQFEELDQQRTLAEQDDEVTFLQSVMTASEFPSHYTYTAEREGLPPHSTISHQVKEQKKYNAKTKKAEKKSAKKREKEERRKRRKAKQEGQSDTRILDAVYGHMKTSSQKQSSSHRKPTCEDSYEDSYNDFPLLGHRAVSREPANAASQDPRSALHGQLKSHRLPPDPEQFQDAALYSSVPMQQNQRKYDSFDTYSAQEYAGVNRFEAQAPLPDPSRHGQGPQNHALPQHHQHNFQQHPSQPQRQSPFGQMTPTHPQQHMRQPPHCNQAPQAHPFPQHHGFQQQQQQQGNAQQYGYQQQHQPSQLEQYPPTGRRHYEPETIVLHDAYSSGNPERRSFEYQGPPQPAHAHKYGSQPQDLHRKDEKQNTGYDEEPTDQTEDEHQRVTWDSHEYVIPEPEAIKRDQYWQQQLKQQKKQKQYRQQQAVEHQLQKEREQQKKWQEQKKELKQQATLRISSPKSSVQGGPDVEYDDAEKYQHSSEDQPSEDQPQQEDANVPIYDKDEYNNLEEKYLDDQEDIPEGDTHGIGQEEAADGEDAITACWTQNEIEMVLENDLPRHSGASPRNGPPSPGHPSHGRSSSPRKNSNSNSSPTQKTKTKPGRGGKHVPSLIFAMVQEHEKVEASESSDRDRNGIADLEDSVNEIAVQRLSNPGIQRKPPPSPRHRQSTRREAKPRQNSRNERDVPSTLGSNHKDSLITSVRSRKHPQVDPAEIESRILAAAYDHESACSSTSAPSLSVYSSASSDFSLYLGKDRKRNEASQRATRHLSSNAYKHIRSQKKQQNIPEDKGGLVVDPDAAYVSEDEEELEGTYEDDYDEEEEYDDDDDDDDDDDEGSRTFIDGEEESSDEGSYSDEDEYDDEDSVWDEKSGQRHLHAYDVEDDEEDLMETPRPRYLRDCLELLRTSETDDHARSKQECALKYLPQLIQGKAKPADLPDLAVPIALELMRMEDKFDIKNFSDSKLISAIALTVEEPLSVGQRLILLLWEDVAFMDRLDVLTVLSESAFELSGNKELEAWHKGNDKNG